MSTTSPQKRSKAWGYEVEKAAERTLRLIFPNLRRTGSANYFKDAADLAQAGEGPPMRLIVTRDKGRPMLVTMALADFVDLAASDPTLRPVVVQCKGRQRTWIGSLYDALVRATR